MFWHLYKYHFKASIRNKSAIFWSFAFPLILATLFYFGFGNLLNDSEELKPVPAAIVETKAAKDAEGFKQTGAGVTVGMNPFNLSNCYVSFGLSPSVPRGLLKSFRIFCRLRLHNCCRDWFQFLRIV